MKIHSVLQRVAVSGLLLSCPFLFNGFGVAMEANGAVSAIQRNLAFNQSQSDEDATVASSQVDDDDDDDDDDERALAVFESVNKASAKAMRSIKTNAIVNKVLNRDQKLEKTKALFDKYKLKQNDPATFFKHPNVNKWGEATRKLYGREDEKAYAAMFLTLLTRMKGDEEAVATLLGSSHSHYASYMIVAQSKHWKAKNLDTTMVYNLLNLRKEGSELFNSPKLRTWVNFAAENKEDSSAKLWQLMTSQYQNGNVVNPYSPLELALLVRAKPKSSNAELLAQSAAKLLLAKWRSDNYPIKWALHNMGVIEPELGVWLAYTSKLQDPYQIFWTAGKFKNEEVKRAINAALLSDDNNLVKSAESTRQIKIEQGFEL